MPLSAEHKQETRERIVKSARRLFNRRGFAAVTIDDIMGEAGLTHGGFYKHFSAKEELYQAAVLQFICGEQPEGWQAKHIDPSAYGASMARMVVDAYLSAEHFEDYEGSCPMIALPSDVARGNGSVKAAFRQVMEMLVEVFADNLEQTEDGSPSREKALALVAMTVGGMVLARAVDDEALSNEIRQSARKYVMETTGWDNGEDRRPEASA